MRHAQPDHHDQPPPPAGLSSERFAPLFTRTGEPAITTMEDERGRPLLGVFVPDGKLL